MVVRGQVAEQLALLNAYRARHGAGPLTIVPELTVAAQRHVDDMVAKRFFAHQGSDGTSPAQRAAQAGYPGDAGENLGLRSDNAAAQMAGWIMSPAHHANLLDPRWTAIGIAVGNGDDGVLWANVFGDKVTCPPASMPQPTPIVLANPVVARPAGTLGDGAATAVRSTPSPPTPTCTRRPSPRPRPPAPVSLQMQRPCRRGRRSGSDADGAGPGDGRLRSDAERRPGDHGRQPHP